MSRAKAEPVEADLGDYTDYLLLSSSEFTNGWKHNVMRLAPSSASDVVDPRRWTSAKLNRRDQRRIRREEEEMSKKAAEEAELAENARNAKDGSGVAVSTTGLNDIKPGMPGYMAIKKEKEERDDRLVAPGPSGSKSEGKVAVFRPKRGFGAPKKTRRVFITDESSKQRRIHFEEQHPWMLETDGDQKPPQSTRWVGKMDAAASAQANGGEGSSYALLVLDTTPGSEAAFKVVPANRWYRFTSRPRYQTMGVEEAEEEYKKMQKSGDMDIWFAQRRAMPSTSTASASQAKVSRGPDSFLGNGSAQSGGYKSRLAQARGREDSQMSSVSGRFKSVVGRDRPANDEDLWGDEEAAGPSQKRAGKTKVKPRRREGVSFLLSASVSADHEAHRLKMNTKNSTSKTTSKMMRRALARLAMKL